MSVVAVVPAAGSGTRLGATVPKAFVGLAGSPLVVHAVEGLLRSGVVDRVVVTVPDGYVGYARALLAGRPVEVLVGGADRTDSVRCALALLESAHGGERASRPTGDGRIRAGVHDVVLVHDAARPLTPPELTAAVVEAVRAGARAVVPVLPLADTVKRVDADGRVRATVDRSLLRAVQTPQGFVADVLRRAYAVIRASTTDDAGLVEALGEPVHTVPGHAHAFKVTTPWDLELAELLLTGRVR